MFLNDFCFKEGNKSCKIYYSLCHYRFWLIIRDISYNGFNCYVLQGTKF